MKMFLQSVIYFGMIHIENVSTTLDAYLGSEMFSHSFTWIGKIVSNPKEIKKNSKVFPYSLMLIRTSKYFDNL